MELRSIVFGALLAVVVHAHNEHGHVDMTSSSTPAMNDTASTWKFSNHDHWDYPSYAGLESQGMMIAHIGLMISAWFFILPIGVMFSVARSKLAFLVQSIFLVVNLLGLVTATIANSSTPDLYINNAHHKIGWVATWIVTAHVAMSLIFIYSGRNATSSTSSERASFLPQTLHRMNRPVLKKTWSGDSGQGTEPYSSSSSARTSRTLSPDRDYEYTKEDQLDEMDEVPLQQSPKSTWFKSSRIDGFLSRNVPKLASRRFMKVVEVLYEIVDRTILILGFIAITTGIVAYTGIFRDNNVFNGLAHWIKGGIFFWYGLLTLGRWLGSFADLGWAWNARPTRSEVGWKARAPSAEFTESFVIFLYGCTNVFLEHLAASGDEWTAQDIEHVSISIMFFGGGLAGMLVESTLIRKWLNTTIDEMPMRSDIHPDEAQELREEPKQYTTSLNIIPALIILLLGIMMSSHHQDSAISTTVHAQWGTLLCCFSLARGVTYVTMYLSPPKSVYPSRPPTELAAAFCLISGGLVFMLSTKDIIHWIEYYRLMPMFVFTVVMGLSMFIVAYTVFVVGLKGWAVRREHMKSGRKPF